MNTNNQPNVAVEATVEETLQAKKARITTERNALSADIKMLTARIEKLKKLDSDTVSSRDADLIKCNDQLKEKENKKAEKETELDNLESEEKNAEKIAAKLKLKDAVTQFLTNNPSAAYILDDDAYYYIEDQADDDGGQNIIERHLSTQLFTKLIATDYKIPGSQVNGTEILDLVALANRKFDRKCYTINEKNWKQKNTYLPFKYMETYFIDKAKVTAIDPAVINCFEQLMYSLSGGKDENKNHIEQWIVHKVLNYRKAASTPDLVIVGPDGGNGKGIIQEIMKKMFVSKLCGMANAKTLHGNFNSILMGKLLVFFDDQDKTQIPLEVVKQLAGASSMIVEKKGHDQVEIEKTHSSAFFSNVLPFALSSAGKEGGVDRRFSVIRTDITLIESVIKHAADRGENITSSQAVELMDDMINNILYNRNNIAQWFQYLKAKHSHIDDKFVLKALHGADYQEFLKQQNTEYDLIWDRLIVPSLDAGQVVPMFVIKEVLRRQNGSDIGEKTINAEIEKRINTSKKKYKAADKRATVRMGVDENSPVKRCSYFYNVNAKGKLFFDWSQVSLRDYVSVPKHEELIKEDDYIFNSAPEEVPPILQASSSRYAKYINNIKNRDISPEID